MNFELEARLRQLDALERETDAWNEAQRETLMQLRSLSDEIQQEAWQRVLRRLRQDAGFEPALRELAADPVVYAVLRRFGLLRPSLDERIHAALKPVRPMLHAHGGDVEIAEIRPPDTVLLRMTGACDGCPASAVTLAAGVVRAIRDACPEILSVQDISTGTPSPMPQDTVSPFAADAG